MISFFKMIRTLYKITIRLNNEKATMTSDDVMNMVWVLAFSKVRLDEMIVKIEAMERVRLGPGGGINKGEGRLGGVVGEREREL